jgi:Fur family peroxide stress response transcriptional regulator
MRMTPQRKVIIDILKSTKSHPDALWIYQNATKKIPRMGLGTVYRTLDQLEREGEIKRIDFKGIAHYDANVHIHPHLLCSKCGKIVDISESYDFDVNSLDLKGFKVESVNLDIIGICPECQSKKEVN